MGGGRRRRVDEEGVWGRAGRAGGSKGVWGGGKWLKRWEGGRGERAESWGGGWGWGVMRVSHGLSLLIDICLCSRLSSPPLPPRFFSSPPHPQLSTPNPLPFPPFFVRLSVCFVVVIVLF